MKMTALFGIAPCSLFIDLMMEPVRTSETSVYFNETTRRYIPEGCHLAISLFSVWLKPLAPARHKYNTNMKLIHPVTLEN
jgi:hypothetical protein